MNSENIIKEHLPTIEPLLSVIPLKTDTVLRTNCSVASLIFYLRFNVVCENMVFNGEAGGISVPGAGAFFGDLFITTTVEELFDRTVSFAFVSTPVYLNIMFFDNDNRLLGHLQSGGVSIVTGTGGGSGKWVKK